ncbi:MAG: flagellar biosynthesis protein FliQ [Candidatus Eremiobacteraeota bacterium]|nr:flagellar biosynthesis protein FliQ [Candidatus Eremiobacteraeota bacterium]
MTEDFVLHITSRALYLTLLLSAPMLLAALGTGLVISILQATTQIQEQTISFVPKIVATFAAVVICATWISSMISSFAIEIFSGFPAIINNQ